MSSHFRRKHFKNTLNTYLFSVGVCGCQNLTDQILHNFARSLQKRQKLEKLCFLNNFPVISGTFSKNCRSLFKNANWIPGPVVLELRNCPMGTFLGRFDKFLTEKKVFFKHSASFFRKFKVF